MNNTRVYCVQPSVIFTNCIEIAIFFCDCMFRLNLFIFYDLAQARVENLNFIMENV